MSFLSVKFVAFLLPALFLYYLAPRRAQWIVLLFASAVFYALSGLANAAFLLLSVTATYFGARAAARLVSSGDPGGRRRAKWLVGLLLALNFCMLAAFKWHGTAQSLAPLAERLGLMVDSGGIVLPLGISFYTFQATGYLIDVYRQRIAPERNYARFFLFVSFFPQLVQGPISPFEHLSAQLTAAHAFDYTRLKSGAQRMLYGCMKKLVIADALAPLTARIFEDTAAYPGMYIALAAVLGTFQLYCDFSGGIDMALGAAELFGIALPENFRQPFFSRSLPEYWRRWHITLNDWWREYLFFPVALSRPMNRLGRFLRKHTGPTFSKIASVYVGILVVRTANALWHGISYKYLASGLYVGALMIGALALRGPFAKAVETLGIRAESRPWRAFQMLRTFLLLCVNRLFLQSERLSAALTAFRNLFSTFNPEIFVNGALKKLHFPLERSLPVCAGLFVVLIVDILRERGVPIRSRLNKAPLAVEWSVMLALIFFTLLFGRYGAAYDAGSFIYAGF